jgi:NADH-quinone oxidoreductase subunit M
MADLTRTERLALLPVIGLMFVLGLYPQLITGLVHTTVMQWTMSLSQGVRF